MLLRRKMSIEAEYETYLAHLKESIEGQELLLALPGISKKLFVFLSESKEFPLIQSALHYMSEEESLLYLKKNFLLIFGRILVFARNFDALDLHVKIEKLLDLFLIVKEEQNFWLIDYKKKIEPVHDKAERRKRRKEFLAQGSSFEKQDKPICEEWVRTLFANLLPKGTNSLFLPSMAKFFLPTNFLESLATKNIEEIMEVVHSKKWKESLLFLCISFLFQDVFVKKDFLPSQSSSVELSESMLEKGKNITAWMLELLSIVDPLLRFLPREEVAQKSIVLIGHYLESFSLERCIIKMGRKLFSEKMLIGNLDHLIDGITGDTKAISFLIKKYAPFFMDSPKLSLTPSIGEILVLGVKGAAIETAIQEKAANLVFQEIPLKIIQSIRLFVLSSFFDRILYRFRF